MKSTIKVGVGIMVSVILLTNLSYGKEKDSDAAPDLPSSINHILSDEGLKGAIAGVSVRSGVSGEILFDHHGDTRLTPASNMKLITAAAALEVLGDDYVFSTELASTGQIDGGLLNGDLYLIGRGDPTLVEEDLKEFANVLHEKGIKGIKGDLVGDESWYDSQKLSEDMIWTDETEYYGSQVSALTLSPNSDYDAGTIMIDVYPAHKKGENAKVVTSPSTDYVTIHNTATTVDQDIETELVIKRKHGTNIITVEGDIPLNSPVERSWISVSNPANYALHIFKQTLTDAGIALEGTIRIDQAPEQRSTLIRKKSLKLNDLLIPFMKLSNNGHGEILVKEMGKHVKNDGSWEAGLEVVNDYLKKEGLNPDDMLLRDGSGISHVTLIQPHQLSLLLFKVQSKGWFDDYLTSLPVAGTKGRLVGGTLRNRMKGTAAENKIIAKTGTLQGVSSLSGYVKNNEPLVFSIIINQFLDEEKIEEIENRIAIALAEYEPK